MDLRTFLWWLFRWWDCAFLMMYTASIPEIISKPSGMQSRHIDWEFCISVVEKTFEDDISYGIINALRDHPINPTPKVSFTQDQPSFQLSTRQPGDQCLEKKSINK
jgi:hypothetical protein